MNKCYMCMYFQKYYIKGLTKFDGLKIGRCCIKDDTVNMHDCCCENFSRAVISRKNRLVIKHRLNDVLMDLSELRSMLEENDVDNKDM